MSSKKKSEAIRKRAALKREMENRKAETTTRPLAARAAAASESEIKLTPRTRFLIMERDNFRCRLCGMDTADGVKLELDHIIPPNRGGGTTLANLWTLCRICNRGKGDALMNLERVSQLASRRRVKME